MKEDDSINLIRYWQVINRRRILILLIVIAAVAAAIVVTLVSPKTYRATALVQLSNPQISSLATEELSKEEQNFGLRRSVSYLAEAATSDSLLKKVIASQHLKMSIFDLRARIQVNVAETGNLLTISVDYSDARGASLIANALAEEVVKYVSGEDRARKGFLLNKSRRLQGELQEIEDHRKIGEEILSQAKTDPALNGAAKISTEAQALQALSSLYALTKDLTQENEKLQALLSESGDTKISKTAEVPRRFNEYPLSFNIAFAVILGISGGIAVAFLTDFWQKSS